MKCCCCNVFLFFESTHKKFPVNKQVRKNFQQKSNDTKTTQLALSLSLNSFFTRKNKAATKKQQQKSSGVKATTKTTFVLRDDSPKLDFDDDFHARSDRESGENERRDFSSEGRCFVMMMMMMMMMMMNNDDDDDQTKTTNAF